MVDGGWEVLNCRRQVVDGGWQRADGGGRRANE